MKKQYLLLTAIFAIFVIGSCDLIQEEPPTKTQMEGTWEVTRATDTELGIDITNRVNFPITVFHLSSDNGIVSTAGPLIMYIVYGDSKYVQIASSIDQVFNYASLDFNSADYYIGDGVQERFTIEMRLEGLPGQTTIVTLLEMIGIGNGYLEQTIFHKFLDVKVDFSEDYNTMIWELDNATYAEYNTRDSHGDPILWGGWPVSNFSHVQIVMEKRVKDIRDLVEEASN